MNGDEIIKVLEAMRGPWLGDGFTKIHRDEIINEIKNLQRTLQYEVDCVDAATDTIQKLTCADFPAVKDARKAAEASLAYYRKMMEKEK